MSYRAKLILSVHWMWFRKTSRMKIYHL